jgi:hypothetical protein
MSQGRRVETMRAAMAAFNRRDGEALGAVLAEDAEIVPVRAAVDGTVYRGPDTPIAPTPSTPWGCRDRPNPGPEPSVVDSKAF